MRNSEKYAIFLHLQRGNLPNVYIFKSIDKHFCMSTLLLSWRLIAFSCLCVDTKPQPEACQLSGKKDTEGNIKPGCVKSTCVYTLLFYVEIKQRRL